MDKKGRRRSKNSTTAQHTHKHTHTLPHTTTRNRYHFRMGKAPDTPQFSDADRTDPSAAASLRVSPVTTVLDRRCHSLALLEDDCQKNARRHSKVHHHHSFDALESILEKVTLMLKNPS
mmetsp:Transcript_24335/g.28190  ORF Transcript_24335/g.28190 Transcript_24335/m.28190 type:complete len:119 (+) Transcript_24335:643-999(+)